MAAFRSAFVSVRTIRSGGGQGLLSSEAPLEDQIFRARVLVVDDSPTVLSLLRAALEAQQYTVATAPMAPKP